MPQAQVVASFVENGQACLAVRVGAREYVGRVPFDADFQAMSPTQRKAALVAAAKKVYDDSQPPGTIDLGIGGGSVTI